MDETRPHTRVLDFIVRVQAPEDVDPEVVRRRLVEAGEDHMTSFGDARVITVQPLDLETGTGRQALDRVLHPPEGTTTHCWCGQPLDRAVGVYDEWGAVEPGSDPLA